MFDLYFFDLHQPSDLPSADPAGLLVVPQPKRGARGRDGDLLIVSLTFNGPSPYLPPAEKDLLNKIAAVYYKSSGSVTSGLRMAAEQVNSILLERNLREGSEGVQAFGLLVLAVLREGTLFLAQSGPIHSLVLSVGGLLDNSDEISPEHALGAGKATQVRFYQSEIHAGDLVLLCANPPASWNAENLAGCSLLTLEHLRRRLLTLDNAGRSAMVIKFQPGKGQIHPLRLRPVNVPGANAIPAQVVPPANPPNPPHTGNQVQSSAPILPAQWAHPVEQAHQSPAPIAAPVQPQSPDRVAQAEAANARLAARRMAVNQRRKKMARAWLGWKNMGQRMSTGWKNIISRLSPHQSTVPVSLSAGSMLFIALVIPILVVVVAVTVYFQTGRTEQRQIYFQQVAAYTAQALAQTDPVLQRNDWLQVLQWLDKTETYGATDETRTLRQRAQKGVDSMDKIVRLDFLPVNLTGFAVSVKITRVLANSSGDIFVLDGTSGRVTRLNLVNQAYEIDMRFDCGPGTTAPILTGPLVDIDLMPSGNPYNASLIGLDNRGSVVFCIQGKPAISAQLPIPAEGWGAPSRIRFASNTLNVLDIKKDDVWRFPANKDMTFDTAPRSFFKDRKTVTLNDVIDMTVYNDDLFLLRGNGRVVKCQDPKVKDVPVRCSDPAIFEDSRASRASSPTILEDTKFIQLMVVETPNPSLYILDRSATAIYQFSMALYLNEQYRAQPYSGDLPATGETLSAFTVTSNRRLFIAFSNRLFFAIIQ